MPSNIVSVERAQLDTQYKQANIAILGNMAIGVLTLLFYWDIADKLFLKIWLSVLFITQIARCVLVFKYQKAESASLSNSQWLHIYTFGTLITGLCWGTLGSALVLGCEGEDLVILFLALVGLTGGSIATSAYRKRLLLAFSTPALVPAGILGFFGDQISMTLGAFSIALWVLSWVAIRRLNESIITALTLGFENQSLVKELEKDKAQLEKTNERLSRELQQKLSMTKWLATGNWYASKPEYHAKTDISNGSFSETVMDIWETAIEEQTPLSMVIFQIDNMDINSTPEKDSKTDEGLNELQQLIGSEIRGQDQYLKINDSEYALILANMPATDATSLVNRIRNKLASMPSALTLDDGTQITLSFGVAGWVPDVTQNSSELVSACRKAKNMSIEEGGNCVNIG